MTRKTRQKIILCAVLFAVLVAAYFLIVRPIVNSIEEKEPMETLPGDILGTNDRFLLFPQIKRAQMQSIAVTGPGGEYEIYRDSEGTFRLRGSEAMTLDATRLSAIVTATGYTLAKLRVSVDATDAELAEYGLDEPQASWRLTATDGAVYTVEVGYDLLTGAGYYCRLAGDRNVYVLDATVSVMLNPPEYFVTPSLIEGISSNAFYEITNFALMQGKELFIGVRRLAAEEQYDPEALAEYKMTCPDGYYPNNEVFVGTLYLLPTLVGDEVVKLNPTEEDFRSYGLMEPAYTLGFDYDGIRYSMIFSEKTEDGYYYVVSSLYTKAISRISAETVSFLEKKTIDWISEYPFESYITDIASIEIEGSGASVTFSLTHEKGETEEENLLTVTASNGLVIKNKNAGNFRQFYKTLLSIAIIDYVPLSEAEIAALTAEEKNCLLTFTYTTVKGETTVLRFYPYSGTGRRSLMTVNGTGEFYVQTDIIEKIASDANKLLAGLDVDAYSKS